MRLFKFLILLSFIVLSNLANGQLIFKSLKELNEYAFQSSNLNELTEGYFLDYINNFDPSKKDSVILSFNEEEVTTNKLFSLLNLLEMTDVSQSFESDSLIFPTFNDLVANDGQRQINIPLFIGDIDVNYLSESAYYQFQNWNSEAAYPALSSNQLESERLTVAGLLIDTLMNSNIHIYWDEESYITNTNRDIAIVKMFIGDEVIELQKSQKVDLSSFYNSRQALGGISFQVVFSDSSTILNNSKCFISEPSNLPTKLDIDSQAKFSFWNFMGGFNTIAYFGEDPELQFSVLWGCGNENKLKKPYIFITGYGPYTDDWLINYMQGWPSSIQDAYWQFNQEGYIDELSGAGYDVIIVKFYPPNASVVKNAQALVKLIEMVNEEKFKNHSYEENIINGYSAGAMATRLALQMMEKNHLENNAPNHHTKLNVSYDGEHGGAHVPLGVQHSVKHLKQYQHGILNGNLSMVNSKRIKALYHLLNSKLSKELLYYFYTETGDPETPGQGPSQDRLDYLQKHEDFNHQFSWRNPDYPIFTRNISVSNGISQSRINGENSDHYPFPEKEGHTFFKHERSGRRWQAHFAAPGWENAAVFRYDEKSWWQWEIIDEARVHNPWILDNAPGGTSSVAKPEDEKDVNTMFHIINLLQKTTTPVFGSADIARFETLYSFTPTVLTHDIRHFDPFENNGMGRMHFDMKNEGMMYQHENQVGNPILSSSLFGYPHLGNHWDIFALNDAGLQYTPFDAVFSWDNVNTVHLTNRELIFDEDRNDAKGGWIENVDDKFLRTEIRDFLVDESDYFNAYVQNRNYGENANINHTYKADIIARNEIYAGSRVTQRTNFRSVEIQENADISFQACKTVYLKPGFHVKSGSSFYAGITDENCTCGGLSGKSGQINNQNNYTNIEDATREISENELNPVNSLVVRLYPNPGKDIVNLVVEDEIAHGFEYKVFSTMGVLVEEKQIDGYTAKLTLRKGMYIIKVKYKGEWHTRKLIMQ